MNYRTFLSRCFVLIFLYISSGCGNPDIKYIQDNNMLKAIHYTSDTIENLNYTVYEPVNNEPAGLLIFFHGAGGSADSWQSFGRNIENYWKKEGMAPPLVVSISRGPVWFLTGETSLISQDLINVVREEILLPLETQYKLPEKRTLIGLSMGGFNALSFYVSDPDYFNRILLISPALITVSPFSSSKEVDDYAARTQAYSFKQKIKTLLAGKKIYTGNINTIISNLKTAAATEEDWELINPLQKLEKMKEIPGKFLIASAKKDIYGFQEGIEELRLLLIKENALTDFIEVDDTRHLLTLPEEALSFIAFP